MNGDLRIVGQSAPVISESRWLDAVLAALLIGDVVLFASIGIYLLSRV